MTHKKSIISFIAILGSIALLTSCIKEDIASNSVIQDAETLAASTHSFTEEVSYEDTRSKLYFDDTNNELAFEWEQGDRLLLFNQSTANDGTSSVTYAEYALKSIISKKTALFSGGGFNLADGYNYYAFSPYDALIQNGKRQEVSCLQLSYEGQHQSANGNSDHLGAYDYQTAMSYSGTDGRLNFDFKHLGATLRIKMKITDEDAMKRAYKKLTLYTSDNYDFHMTRTINLLQNAESPSDYHPAFDATADETDGTILHTITLDLGEDGNGIVPDEDGFLYMYLAIPASSELYNDGSPRTIYAEVTPVDADAPHYNISFLAKDYKAGTCYTIGRKAVKSGEATLQIYVDRAWQNEYADVTRGAIGDPGNDKGLDYPTKLQIYTCVNGSLKKSTSITVKPEDWKEDGTRLQYQKSITLQLGAVDATTKNVRSYVVASNDEEFDVSTPDLGTEESSIRQLTFSYTKKTDQQQLLGNLYSTPYIDGSDNGLSTDMTNLNLIACLYHVACKVDLNWEANISKPLAKYTVKYLLKQGYLFLPTENVPSTKSSATTYTSTTGALKEIIGRDYFYAIQQRELNDVGEYIFPLSLTWTYDVKNSPTTTENIKLKTSDGRTSWYRINRKW